MQAYAGKKSMIIGQPFNKAEMLVGNNHVPNVTVMMPRQIIEDIGFYDPHILLKRFCDWDLWVRISNKYAVRYVPHVLADEYGGLLPESLGNSISLNTPLMLKYVKQYATLCCIQAGLSSMIHSSGLIPSPVPRLRK